MGKSLMDNYEMAVRRVDERDLAGIDGESFRRGGSFERERERETEYRINVLPDVTKRTLVE